MSDANNKSKEATPKKPAVETKAVETKAGDGKAGETKAVEAKPAEAKSDTSTKTESKPEAAAKKQGMGEGQKAVSKAYKDNWNDIFGKKKKR
jgi:hypothetical protein